MVQGGQDQPFQDHLVTLLAQNSLLMGTTSHLSNAKLRHQLEAGLELCLLQKIESNTVIAALDADDFTNGTLKSNMLMILSMQKHCTLRRSLLTIMTDLDVIIRLRIP